MDESGHTLDSQARQVLIDNDRGGYTVPTSGLYPFQWNWDSAFCALGWATFDRPRAWSELEKLMSGQWPSGMVPHILFWSDESTYFPGPEVWQANRGPVPSSGITQPPVVASAVRQLVESGSEQELDRAEALFDGIDRWHRWFLSARDPDGLGVIAVTHPWESGRDNLPDWDEAMASLDTSGVGEYQRRDLDLVDSSMRPHKADYDRYLAIVQFGARNEWNDQVIAAEAPFFVADPGTSAILLRAERDLMWLAERLGRDTAPIQERIDLLSEGFERFWNPVAGTYCSIDLRADKMFDTGTSASFLAPFAGIDRHLDELCDELETWSTVVDLLVPSFDPRHPAFEPNRYWRGPVWIMINYMIATGLAECGRADLARSVHGSSHQLALQSGFPESYNPVTGGAVGGGHFSWTAALWLAWTRTGGAVQ